MNRFWTIHVWLSVVIVSSLAQTAPLPNKAKITDEDYAIFASALDDLYGKKNVESVLLLDHTWIGFPPSKAATTRFQGKDQTFFTGFPKQARDDFDTRNKSHVEIEAGKIKASFEVILMSDEEAGNFHVRGWKEFRDKYPRTQGIMVLSRPGINRERQPRHIYES